MPIANQLTEYLFKAKKFTEEDDKPLDAFKRITCVSGGLTLFVHGIKKKKFTYSMSGASLLLMGITGFSPFHYFKGLFKGDSGQPIEITTTLTVNKPQKEVYNYWRKLENLPDFMTHLASVKEIDERKSRWKAEWGDTLLSWEATIVKDIVNKSLAWRSLPSSEIKTFGEVNFKPAPGKRGTEVHLKLNYEPMAGPAGKAVAKLMTMPLEKQIRDDLRNFKRVLETGQRPLETSRVSGRSDSQSSAA